jgi:hypothetical protein
MLQTRTDSGHIIAGLDFFHALIFLSQIPTDSSLSIPTPAPQPTSPVDLHQRRPSLASPVYTIPFPPLLHSLSPSSLPSLQSPHLAYSLSGLPSSRTGSAGGGGASRMEAAQKFFLEETT